MFWLTRALILSVRGEPCLAMVGYTSRWVRSMSLTLRRISSMGLSPVSRLSCSLMLMLVPALAISIRSFSCVGSRIGLVTFS